MILAVGITGSVWATSLIGKGAELRACVLRDHVSILNRIRTAKVGGLAADATWNYTLVGVGAILCAVAFVHLKVGMEVVLICPPVVRGPDFKLNFAALMRTSNVGGLRLGTRNITSAVWSHWT